MAVTVTGVREALRATGKAKEAMGKTIAEVLLQAAHIIKKKADYYCPVEFGNMKATGHVAVEGKGFGAKAFVIYGGPSAPYTLYVHENYFARHDAPTCAGWVTRATRESAGTVTALLKGRKLVKTGERIVDYETSDLSKEPPE